MKNRIRVCVIGVLFSLLCAGQSENFVPVDDKMLQKPDPADWLMWRRTLDSWGYSPLNQINRANVGQLQKVWTHGIGPGVQEGTPLVHDGMLYFTNPSDLIQAYNAATGELIWEYKRDLPQDVTHFLLVPSINRNIAIYGSVWRQLRRLSDPSLRTFFLGMLLFVVVRGFADTEAFDLSLPLWFIAMIGALSERSRIQSEALA